MSNWTDFIWDEVIGFSPAEPKGLDGEIRTSRGGRTESGSTDQEGRTEFRLTPKRIEDAIDFFQETRRLRQPARMVGSEGLGVTEPESMDAHRARTGPPRHEGEA